MQGVQDPHADSPVTPKGVGGMVPGRSAVSPMARVVGTLLVLVVRKLLVPVPNVACSHASCSVEKPAGAVILESCCRESNGAELADKKRAE